MPLQKAVVDFPLSAGLDEATRPEVMEGGFTTLENTRQATRAALSKRPGHTTPRKADNAVSVLASHDDAALFAACADAHVYAYSESRNAWSDRGIAPSLTAVRHGLASLGVFRGTVVYDVARVGGYLFVLYEATRALFAVVLDATTRAPVSGPTQIAAGLSGADALQEFRAMLIVCGNYVVCVYNRENVVALTREDGIYGTAFDTTNFGAGWPVALNITGAGAIDLTVGSFLFDACAIDATSFALVYMNLALGQTIATIACPSMGTNASAAAYTGAAGAAYAFSVDYGGGHLWTARCQTGIDDVFVEARNTALAVTGAAWATAFPSQIIGGETGQVGNCGMVATGAGRAVLVCGGANTLAGNYRRTWLGWRALEISGGGVAASSATSVATSLEPTNKPFVLDGRVYAVVAPQNSLDVIPAGAPVELATATNRERCMFVVDVSEARIFDVPPAANLAPRINATNGMLYFPRYLRNVATFADGHVGFIYPVLRGGDSESLELAELSTLAASPTASLAGLTHLPGAAAWAYDGLKPLETAFLQAPRVVWYATAAGALAGTYLYTAVWEHEDARGNTHYSEPAAPITVVAAGAAQVLRITCPSATRRMENVQQSDRVRCVLYRTAAGGSTYYRCAEASAYDGASLYGNMFVAITDNMTDATLTQRARLYTQPGTPGTSLPRRAPPGLRYVVQHGDILAGIADDRRTIWFSAPVVDGEGPWFNDAFVVVVDDDTPLTALASFDGRLYAFTTDGVWAIDGNGFSENGAGGFALPQRVPVDVGCVEPRSVCVTPDGAIFLSALGLCMLTRKLQVVFFGEMVQTTLAAYPTVTSAVLLPGEGRVLISCRNGSAGLLLSYDTTLGVWSTETGVAAAACLAGGVYHRALSSTVSKRSTSSYLDGSTWVGQTITTGWIKLAGLQGYQRVWRVLLEFARQSAFSLKVSFAFDYSATFAESRTWTEAEIAALAEGRVEIAPSRQKCRAIRVKVEELTPATVGTGQGLELVGLRFVVGIKERAGFPAAAKR